MSQPEDQRTCARIPSNRRSPARAAALALLSLLAAKPAAAAGDHLVLSEVVLTPTAGEFVEIANPTASPVELADFYLSDHADYALLPGRDGGGPAPEIGSGDFIVRFPPGSMIAAGGVVVVAVDGAGFKGEHGFQADFEIKGTDPGTPDMRRVAGKGSPGLTDSGEIAVLFTWDGQSDLVADVDMVRVGDPSDGNDLGDKSGVSVDGPDAGFEASAYRAEAGAMPRLRSKPGGGESAKRALSESGYEIATAGNGVTGDDETSENVLATWDGVYTPYSAPDPGRFAPRTPRRFVVCLDGTWNSPQNKKERDDGTGVYKPTNPLKLCRAVAASTAAAGSRLSQITYYDAGVGATNAYPGRSNRILRWIDTNLGGAWGAGFEGKIEGAYRFLAHNYLPGDEIFVFGFSRGAAAAQGLCNLIDWMGGFPAKQDVYYLPELLLEYLQRKKGQAEPRAADALERINDRRVADDPPRDPLQPFIAAPVRFLGVWDTVMALSQARSFHTTPSPAAVVEIARHALALDERRKDFLPEVWAKPARPWQSLEQRWFAGVHSNVGGGYVLDGLANVALHWLVNEAKAAGLAVDHDFLSFYGADPNNKLYKSRTFLYKLRELGSKKGIRELSPEARGLDPEESGLSLDPTVYERLAGDPTYRPKNLLKYLADHPDPERPLPDDVAAEVRQIREGKR